jgi:hypothetical protein
MLYAWAVNWPRQHKRVAILAAFAIRPGLPAATLRADVAPSPVAPAAPPVAPAAPPVAPAAPVTALLAADALKLAVPPCPDAPHCFALRVRVAADNSIPVVLPGWLAQSFAFANQVFAPVGIAFQLDTLAIADAMPLRIDGVRMRDALVLGVSARPVIDLTLVRELIDLEEPSVPRLGVHWRVSNAPQRRFVIVSAAASERVLAHELGHYFGLPHSNYAISIMNKTARTLPPMEARKFADQELPVLRQTLLAILARSELVPIAKPAP